MTETHTRDDKRSWLRRALRVAAPVALVVLLAAPAFAARIVQVRVGNHPTFSRVVFELDSHAGYQIGFRDTADSRVLVLTIDASSPDRGVISKSLGVGSVTVEGVNGQSLALITLRRDDLMVKEMILSNPPRIVLDFEFPVSSSELASTSSTSSTSTTSSGPSVRIDDAPDPATIEPESEPVVVTPVAVAEPEIVAVVQPESIDAAVEVEPAVEPTEIPAQIADTASTSGMLDDRPLGYGAAAAPSDQPDTISDPVSDPISDPVSDTTATEPHTSTRTTAQTRPAPPTSVPAEEPRHIARAQEPPSSDAVPIAAAVAVVGVLLVGGVLMMRRKSSVLNESDVTALADELAEDDVPEPVARTESEPTEFLQGGIPEEGFDMRSAEAVEPAEQVATEVPEETAVIAIVDDGITDDAIADGGDATTVITPDATQVSEADTAAYSLGEVSANSNEPGTELYDEDPEGEKSMDMEASDLPAEHGEFIAAPPVEATDSANSELSSMVQELMTRLGTLETRLDESNEARERLERQVSAQSEELRVQRAAIARTQRALRSLSRTDEDQATEPALRNPSA